MTIPAETLMAYVDGELAADERARVDAEIARDPALKTYVERQQALRRGLHDAFDEILDAPLPERLLAAAKQPPPLHARLGGMLRGLTARRTLVLSGIPAAAALACGLVIGIFVSGPAGNIVPGRNGLVAHGELAVALNEQLAASPAQSAPAKIGISFRDRSGRYCRTFETGGNAGIACHAKTGWSIAMLAQTVPEANANAPYRTAASAMPDAVRASVRGMISGTPLGAEAERKARAAGWKSP
jgi:hypothetical protein